MAPPADLEGGRNSPSNQDTLEKLNDRPKLHASVYITSWILVSNITILFNKWLIDTVGFRYPIILTTWHLIFATIATQILARTTSLLDSRHALPLTRRLYIRTILPIGVLYSGSLIFSNVVYLYLSVAFIQMLKSIGPAFVLFASWIWGVAQPSYSTLANVMIIVVGVGIASMGEIEFSFIGVAFQLAGTVCEAIRLVMIQIMLSAEGLRMDPLVGLYYYAPVCAFLNIFISIIGEGHKFQWADVAKAGYGMLFLNAAVAFVLNVVSVFLIGKTSGLVMSLSGILKSILLVTASVLIWNTKISSLQVLGYTIALIGLVLYSVGHEQLLTIIQDASAWIYDTPGSGRFNGRKVVVVGTVGFSTLLILLSLYELREMSGEEIMKVTASWFGS